MYYFNFDLETTERYDPAKFMPFQDIYDIVDSYFLTELSQLPTIGTYTVTTDNRPDLLSYEIYNNVNYWWILLLYNNLMNFRLTVGQVIRYPSLEAIENMYFQLKAKGLK